MDMNKLLDRVEGLIHRLVDKELIDWKRRQQKSCIGAPDNVCLDQMEKWSAQQLHMNLFAGE